MTENWIICFLLALPMTGVAFFARADQGSWYAPGALFSLLWCGYLFLPLVLLPQQYIWPGGVIAIVVAGAALYIGSLTGFGRLFSVTQLPYLFSSGKASYNAPKARMELPGLVWLTVVGSGLGCCAVAAATMFEGYSLGDFLSAESLSSMGLVFSAARYAEDYRPPLIVLFLSLFMYTAALFGGLLFIQAKNKLQSLLAFVPFVPALLFTIVFTTRASFLFQGILWLSSCMAASVFVQGLKVPLFTKRFNLLILILVPLLFSIVVFALVMRGVDDLMLSLILVDVAGHLGSFSQWLEQSWQQQTEPGYGSFTLAGVSELLGVKSRALGIYEEFVEISAPQGLISTNICTAFRSLIQDFTLPFAPVGLFLMGLISTVAYRRVSAGHVLSIPILGSFYGFALFSHIVSFTAYNSLVGAYCLFFIYMVAVRIGKHISSALSTT